MLIVPIEFIMSWIDVYLKYGCNCAIYGNIVAIAGRC